VSFLFAQRPFRLVWRVLTRTELLDDRAWCVSTDADFVWSCVAASASCIEELLSVPVIDALETRPENLALFGMDVINNSD
jgi:hypothetical protein